MLATVAAGFAVTAGVLVANEIVVGRRILALLRRHPRLAQWNICDRLNHRSGYGVGAVDRVLSRLAARGTIVQEMGEVYDRYNDAFMSVPVWTLRIHARKNAPLVP